MASFYSLRNPGLGPEPFGFKGRRLAQFLGLLQAASQRWVQHRDTRGIGLNRAAQDATWAHNHGRPLLLSAAIMKG